MIHACLSTICFVFCYTLWRFYAFSELTYWRDAIVPVPCFLLFFVFQKSYTGNILGIGRNKSRTSYFFWTKDEDRRRAGGGPEGSHTRGWRAPPLGRARGWCGPPGRPLTPPLRLFKTLQSPNPKSIGNFLEEVPQLRHRHRWISGDRSHCSDTLPGRGSAPRAISIDAIASTAVSIDFTAISTNVAVSYDEEGVVLPWGWGLYR
jgi:hypothetical protein